MNVQIFTLKQLVEFTNNIIAVGEVVGVKKKEDRFQFAPLKNADELVLDYDVTLLPPKKYILPQKETLLSFKIKPATEVEEVCEIIPVTIFGVHPYDLKAINQLDRLFEEKYPEGNYLKRRAAVTIVAVMPKRASKWAFWSSVDSSSVNIGFDLLLTDIGGKFAVEVGSKRGEVLLAKHAKFTIASKTETEKLEHAKKLVLKMCAPERVVTTEPSKIPALLEKSEKSDFWKKQAEKCYSCGSCNLVCPTCYCFDVHDYVELNLSEGKRYRVWDGCLLEDFSKVASGENFRKERKNRYMHRYYRKGSYLADKMGELACVGCGRCASVCLPDIADPVKAFNTLKEEA